MNDVSTTRSCFLTTQNVVIDLNGYTISFAQGYNSLNNGGFEQGTTGWDLSGAPTASIRSTHGDMPLVGDNVLWVPANQEIVSDWITLPVASRSYRGYVVERGTGDVRVRVENDIGTTVCDHTRAPYLGGGTIMCTFNGQPSGRYRLRISSQGDHYFDEANILPVHDAAIGSTGWYGGLGCDQDDGSCEFPDYAAQGAPTASSGTIEVRNGSIVAAPTIHSFGLKLGYVNKTVLDSLSVRVNGIADKAFLLGDNSTVINSKFYGNAPWVENREDILEALTNIGGSSEIANNYFEGGQGVIYVGGNGTRVHNNNIRNKQTVTNHYAITIGKYSGVEISHNLFQPISGSGILIYFSSNANIYGNTFNVKAEQCDAEYTSAEFTTNAIRITDYNSTPGVQNTKIYSNTFNIQSSFYPDYPGCLPIANGIFASIKGIDNQIYSNTFNVANSDPHSMAYAFYIGSADNGGYYHNNVVTSNDAAGWLASRYGSASGVVLEDNNFLKGDDSAIIAQGGHSYFPFKIGYCCGWNANVTFLNNSYSGTAQDIYFFSNNRDPFSFLWKWKLYVHAQDAAGSAVVGASVQAVSSKETVSGTTDNQGDAILSLTQDSWSGTSLSYEPVINKTTYTPYTVTVSDGTNQSSRQVSVTSTAFEVLVLGGSGTPAILPQIRSTGGHLASGNRAALNGTNFGLAAGQVIIADQPTLSESRRQEILPVLAWFTSSITFNLRQSIFNAGEQVYLYVLDSSGRSNATGFPITLDLNPSSVPSAPLNLRIGGQ